MAIKEKQIERNLQYALSTAKRDRKTKEDCNCLASFQILNAKVVLNCLQVYQTHTCDT